MKISNITMVAGLSLCFCFCASSQTRKIKDKEKDPQYQYEKAVVAMNYGFVDEAIKYANQALSLDPNHYQSHNLLGSAYFQKKDFAEAASAYEKCAELKPDMAEAHNSLGIVYQQMGQLEKAEGEYKKSLALDGNHKASFSLGKLLFDQNKLEPALEYVQKSIKKNSL